MGPDFASVLGNRGNLRVFTLPPPPPSVGSPTKNGAGGSVFPEEIIVHRDLSFILGVLGGGGRICSAVISAVAGGRWKSGELGGKVRASIQP